MRSKLLLTAAISILGFSAIGGTVNAKQKLLRIPNQYQKTWQMKGNHNKYLQIYRYTAFYNSKSKNKNDSYRMRLHFKKLNANKYGVVTKDNYMPLSFILHHKRLDVYYQKKHFSFYEQKHPKAFKKIKSKDNHNYQNQTHNLNNSMSRRQHLKLDIGNYNALLSKNSNIPMGTAYNYVNRDGKLNDVANSLNYFAYLDGDFQSDQASDYQNDNYYNVAYVKQMRNNILTIYHIFQDQLNRDQKKQMKKVVKQLSGRITSKNVANYAAVMNNLPIQLAQNLK